LELFHRYQVQSCFYGHLHGPSRALALEGLWDGISYKLLSADHLNFVPQRIML
jgi:predicted phosphohydrolase